VQVDPIKPTSKPPGTNLLILKYDEPLSSVAFKFNVRRYSLGSVTEPPCAAKGLVMRYDVRTDAGVSGAAVLLATPTATTRAGAGIGAGIGVAGAGPGGWSDWGVLAGPSLHESFSAYQQDVVSLVTGISYPIRDYC
jgi:hypothetical protein